MKEKYNQSITIICQKRLEQKYKFKLMNQKNNLTEEAAIYILNKKTERLVLFKLIGIIVGLIAGIWLLFLHEWMMIFIGIIAYFFIPFSDQYIRNITLYLNVLKGVFQKKFYRILLLDGLKIFCWTANLIIILTIFVFPVISKVNSSNILPSFVWIYVFLIHTSIECFWGGKIGNYISPPVKTRKINIVIKFLHGIFSFLVSVIILAKIDSMIKLDLVFVGVIFFLLFMIWISSMTYTKSLKIQKNN